MSDRDPRVYFAAERTLLAWVRTGLTVIGLGFVVARFGLFLKIVGRDHPHAEPAWGSTAFGVSLVLLGAFALVMAAIQHIRFRRQLDPNEQPRSYLPNWSVAFTVMLAAVGLLLAVYLGMRSR